MSPAPDRFETLAWVYDQGDLAIILSRLEHADIWVVPLGYHQIAAQWYLTIGLGGVELRVHAEDAAAARALFAEVDWQPRRCSLFSDNRLIEIVLILFVFGIILAPPARMPAEFVPARVEARAEP
jgi:hypothetical protein